MIFLCLSAPCALKLSQPPSRVVGKGGFLDCSICFLSLGLFQTSVHPASSHSHSKAWPISPHPTRFLHLRQVCNSICPNLVWGPAPHMEAATLVIHKRCLLAFILSLVLSFYIEFGSSRLPVCTFLP